MTFAPSEDSDQHGYPPSLIRVLAVRMKTQLVLSYPFSAQPRLWSDWADAQADLSLRWACRPFCWFCHEAAHFTFNYFSWFRRRAGMFDWGTSWRYFHCFLSDCGPPWTSHVTCFTFYQNLFIAASQYQGLFWLENLARENFSLGWKVWDFLNSLRDLALTFSLPMTTVVVFTFHNQRLL